MLWCPGPLEVFRVEGLKRIPAAFGCRVEGFGDG